MNPDNDHSNATHKPMPTKHHHHDYNLFVFPLQLIDGFIVTATISPKDAQSWNIVPLPIESTLHKTIQML